MTDRPTNKRNPAPKIWPALAWERDRVMAGTKNARMVYMPGRAVMLTLSPNTVTIGRYFTSAHNGTPDDIRDAAHRCTQKMHPEVRDAVLAALAAAEGAP